MSHTFQQCTFAASLVLAPILALAPQAIAQSTAHVYVQVGGEAGAVYGYSASSTGQLSPISGSPYKLGTEIIGSNKSQFFTLGHTLLHSYAVGSDGAIQSQQSQIPVFDYSGSSCGNPQTGAGGAVLDHTGKYIYVMLENGSNSCAAYQSYIINSDGSFNFDGDTQLNWDTNGSDAGLPSILGNETFAYSDYAYLDAGRTLIGFQRQSSGTLELMQFNETDPNTNGAGFPDTRFPDASPTGNYVVNQLNPDASPPTYLVSYTVDSQGNLSTTNTLSNAPITSFTNPHTTFSPSGNLFVAYADGGSEFQCCTSGIEIYNFNGANPLTLYKKLLTGTPIDDVAWDSSNHLYAISYATSKLYVFTVTSTSVTQDTSISIGSPYKLVVVSQSGSGSTCAAPTSNGINVCSPAENATVSSPVAINAAAYISGGIYRFELWNGSTKLLSEDNGTMDSSVSLAAGTYKLTFVARNTAGNHYYATRDITVK
ncbi:MAG TPA: hypothetical protein VGR47_03720 [Terracidiphilus sp.]|nr:hypothetical protein [Terracidiphilus sp.]